MKNKIKSGYIVLIALVVVNNVDNKMIAAAPNPRENNLMASLTAFVSSLSALAFTSSDVNSAIEEESSGPTSDRSALSVPE